MDFRGIKRWVRLGLLHAQRKGQHWLITPGEIQRFRGQYCLAAEACRLLGVSASTLTHWRAAGRIEPIYGRGAKLPGSFSLFRRSDILRLLPSGTEPTATQVPLPQECR
jgi:predicted site-specific integrase-resolvase